MDLSESLQVFMTTSLSPWHPSTEITEAALSSVRSLVGDKVQVLIYADCIHPRATEKEFADYDSYLDQLENLTFEHQVTIIERDDWTGLAGSYRDFITEGMSHPLVLTVQHDWEIDSSSIDMQTLCSEMLEHEEIQVVRFHKRPLPQKGNHVDRTYHEVTSYKVPLIATNGWGDSPHIARAEHYRNRVLPNLGKPTDDGRYGVEGPIWKKYQRDIAQYGFEKAQREWGSFVYGKFGDPGRVRHLGDEAAPWRKQRGFVHEW